MEKHQIDYMKRNYPNDWNERTMTSHDTKMAEMVKKIREKYKQVYETRPHTILVEHKALVQQTMPPEVPKAPQNVEPNKVVGRVKPPVADATCQAITITTNKVCGRKEKFGGFCGLHCKK